MSASWWESLARWGRPATCGLAILAAGCSSVAEVHDDAMLRLHADLQQRGVADAAAASDVDPAAVRTAVAELLADGLCEADAVRIALLHNRDVRAAYERLGIAAADLVQAGLLHNPVLDAQALFFQGGGTELEFGIAQPIVDLFQRPLRQRVAAQEFAAAEARIAHELVHLVHSVRREFVRVRAAEQLVGMQQQALSAAVASHELMQQLYEAGNVTAPQLSAERIGEARARLALHDAERAAVEAREPLQRLLGLWGEATAWRLEDDLATGLAGEPLQGLDLVGVEARSVAASLDLRENLAHLQAAAERAGLVRWTSLFPEASLGVAALREPGDEWAVGPTLELELPVFDRGGPRVAAAQARVRELGHRHVQIAVEVRSVARLLRERLERLLVRERYVREELLPAQTQLLRETLQNYGAMQVGAFAVLDQKRQQLASARERLDNLRDAWLARIDLDELLAGSVPTEAMGAYWPGDAGGGAGPDRGGH